MADPIASFSGISSGIQWRDMVEQIMQIESQRRLGPLTTRQSALKAQADAWKQLQSLVAKLRDASATLRNTTAFAAFSATASKSPSTGRDLVSATAADGAAPGTYAVEVLATAKAEKVGSAVFASSATQLGLTGSFSLNGRVITVAASDTLSSLRDKVNSANAGTNASGVSAAILSAPGGLRLVLSADTTGANGIETIDDTAGTLQALGFSDGAVSANFDSTGAAQTRRFSSSSATISSLASVSVPAATTIKVGGNTITIDMSTDSLTTIADQINTAAGSSTAARVVSSTDNGITSYRLVTDLTVDADAGAAVPADSARALAVLGFTRTGRADIAQVMVSANTFTDASTGLAATASTLLTDLQVNGQSLAITAGDTLNVGGARGDGTSVNRTLAVGSGTTVQELLDAINDGTSGFGSGTRTASASLNAGRISIADGTAGDSQLGLLLTVSHSGGSVVSLGAFTTGNGGTSGRSRQISAGTDALLRVDGQVVRSRSNTITDAIAGVTLTALVAEPGTTSQISVSRNTDAIVKSVQDVVTAYNAVRSFISTNAAAGKALGGNASARAIPGSFTSAILNSVVGTSGTFTSAVMSGLQHDRNGVLSLDTAAFTNALKSNFNEIRDLYTLHGTTTDSELSYIAASNKTQATSTGYSVDITQIATQATVTGSVWTTYATAGTADTMTITDGASGVAGSISIANGDTLATITQRLNAMFATKHMQMSASATVDNRLALTSLEYGTTGGFTVAYTPGTADGTAQLGIAAQAYAGVDVAGTINGIAGTGKGQVLTGSADDPSEGLAVRFTGTAPRAAGTVSFAIGVAGALERIARGFADDPGTISAQESTARANSDALTTRITDAQSRLDARRAALVKQFVAMEAAMAKSQQIGAWLSSQIGALESQ